jgi:hypothetical protein
MELTADILEEFVSWQARGKLPDLSAQAFLDEKDREQLITNAGNVIKMIETGDYDLIMHEEFDEDRADTDAIIESMLSMIKADLMEGVTGSV